MKNDTPISLVMTRKPSIVAPGDTLDQVRQIFEKHGFHHIPVVIDDMLVGIVSYTDYIKVLSEMTIGNTPEGKYKTGLAGVLVQDIMTQAVVCLSPTDTVEDAIAAFKVDAFHALPIIDSNLRLVGILSTHDLMKVLENLLAPGAR